MGDKSNLTNITIVLMTLVLIGFVYTYKINRDLRIGTNLLFQQIVAVDQRVHKLEGDDIENKKSTSPNTKALVQAKPDTGLLVSNGHERIELFSDNTNTTIKALSLRLKINNASIVEYNTPDNTELLILGACDESGSKFTSDRLCVDLALGGAKTIKKGDSLGSILIQTPETGIVTLQTETGNGYVEDGKIDLVVDDNREVAKFHIDAPSMPVKFKSVPVSIELPSDWKVDVDGRSGNHSNAVSVSKEDKYQISVIYKPYTDDVVQVASINTQSIMVFGNDYLLITTYKDKQKTEPKFSYVTKTTPEMDRDSKFYQFPGAQGFDYNGEQYYISLQYSEAGLDLSLDSDKKEFSSIQAEMVTIIESLTYSE